MKMSLPLELWLEMTVINHFGKKNSLMVYQVNSNGIIDYNSLTYGDIISTIKQEGLKMCIKHRISKQLNDNKRKAKYEMGNFCEQY
jgi:predicted Fe-Mo cluster-binding NifX family protein